MEVKPMKKFVLVAENKRQQSTDSGIIIEGTRGIGDTAKATVLAIGPEVEGVAVGDVVLLDWAKATPVKVGDVQRAMIKEEFIIAVYENEESSTTV
jgi:co-chaperonin GroES (HSP10)